MRSSIRHAPPIVRAITVQNMSWYNSFMGKQKYVVGGTSPAGTIVSKVPGSSKYMVRCHSCETVRLAHPHESKCMTCYRNRPRKYQPGALLPDGRVIRDVDRSGRQIKLLVECQGCGDLVWKFNGSKDKVCKTCKDNTLLVDGRTKEVGKIVRSYRYSAKKRGYEWNLTDKDVQSIVEMPCEYCKVDGNPYVGIDRKDNKTGYSVGNVVPCCSTCNYAKGKMGYENWNAWLDRLVTARYHG